VVRLIAIFSVDGRVGQTSLRSPVRDQVEEPLNARVWQRCRTLLGEHRLHRLHRLSAGNSWELSGRRQRQPTM